MSEHDEQCQLFIILALYEEAHPELKWVHAIPNGGHRHISVAKAMKAEGLKAGVWDIFVPFQRGSYHGMYIEMKYGNNHLTTNQKRFMQDLGNAYDWRICYCAIEAAQAIGEYLGIEELERIV